LSTALQRRSSRYLSSMPHEVPRQITMTWV
jgi:hypothetical protein